jgi:1-acyl-sn-glycerol-3-phosphate acyltransferase
VCLHRALVAPVVRGAENVPDGAVSERACLFVGNHTRFGLYDLPFLMYELYLRGHKVPPSATACCPLRLL